MKNPNFATNLVNGARQLVAFVTALAIFTAVLFNAFTVKTASVNAENINLPAIIALENVSGEGVGDKVEGTMDKGVGTVQKNFGKATDRPGDVVEGTLKQTKGEAKQNMGEAKAQADMAQEKAENASESLLDSIKDFFE
ncbi:CsbD family protein [Myxosarcina sp. GI1(2024)]